jgi:uncharacterized membrane protein YcaP (DUF421 family)
VDVLLRTSVIYLFLLLVFRSTGKRTLAQVMTFDLVLLLVISEATQQAILGDDYSVITAVLAITTLVAIDIGSSF